MLTDLTVVLVNQPGTLLRASDALGRAGVSIEGACGYASGGQGTFHVLVEDAERARRALIDAGLEVQEERWVVTSPVENTPGSAATVLRRVADAKVNIDLLYVTVDGHLVLGGDDVAAIKRALE
jgi:hypothetical protein